MKQTMKSMDEALKDHYAEKSLSDKQLERLMAISAIQSSRQDIQTTPKAESLWQRLFGRSGNYRYAFYATTCMLLVGFALSLTLLNQPSLLQRVMDEIAYNHRQEMPVEVAATSMSDVGNYLNRLGFSLISPRVFTAGGWQLMGGRYCSINGKLAAQLKVRNISEGKVYTLYQASTEGELAEMGLSMQSGSVNEVKVSVWQEQGLLLGLASTQSQ